MSYDACRLQIAVTATGRDRNCVTGDSDQEEGTGNETGLTLQTQATRRKQFFLVE
jgi:hypothetical protein